MEGVGAQEFGRFDLADPHQAPGSRHLPGGTCEGVVVQGVPTLGLLRMQGLEEVMRAPSGYMPVEQFIAAVCHRLLSYECERVANQTEGEAA